jgi:hypothetical protein
MTPADLKAAAIEIWGERGWVAALASSLGVDRAQVWRYLNGRTDIPGPVAAAVRCWTASFCGTRATPPERPA